ncbi:hypothetical protein VTN77DRAFT_803 [Rasamsonia byssochlamydoides]|uniref:uncharacterized protein n=1 Tax=Rasamsonia byssochlamydoides TaxID=89139 RepID=UPI0037423CC6
MTASPSLRAITHRLTTTPVKELPHLASFLAASLSDCGDILAAPQSQKNANSEAGNALQVHKLKARLTSLLQDRTFEGRWTAVVLVKATVEAGQWEILRECEPWVRGLLAILSKSDPVSTKKLSIITLTRIFHLTYQYQTLVREITTPSLPAFITASLNLVSVKPSSEPHRILKQEAPLLETVLHAFNDLIARHPTTFRPFSAQIHSLLVPIIGSSTSTGSLPEQVVELSQKLFISLHHCAPRNTSGEEWTNACKLTIASIHRTADHAFRSVVEQWESTDPNFRHATISRDSSQLVGDDGPDALGLPGWQGIHAGADRLTTLLRLLSGFISTRTASTVNIPIGAVLDLTSRLTSVTVPRDGDDGNVETNLEISREEREGLWIELPRIHVACIDLFSNIIFSLDTAAIPVIQNILEQTLWLFEAESFHSGVRASSYHLIRRLLPLVGPSMTKANLSALSTVIRSCCRDILPSDANGTSQAHHQTQTKDKPKGNQGSANADAFLNPALKGGNQSRAVAFVGLQSAASKLLPILLSSLPIEYIPMPLRIELDRTAILAADQEAMMASVLNPVPLVNGRRLTPSILPFLARRYPKEQDVECLLRPRMPVLIGGSGLTEPILDEEEDEAENHIVDQSKTGVANHIFENSVPPSLSNQAPPRADVTQNAVHSPNKRNLPEDSQSSDRHTLSNSDDGNQGTPQTKKARLQSDGIVQSGGNQASSSLNGAPVASISRHQPVPVTLSEAAASSPATVPSVSAPIIPSVSNASVSSIPASVAGRVHAADVQRNSKADGQDDGEESDDEIPALNIEPDTDEDEDEEDVSMEG